MLTPAQWQAYKDIVNSVHSSFNQDIITWRRLLHGLHRYGETDNKDNETESDIELRCLIQYNVFRTWPMSEETVGGQIDHESIVMMLNKKYLSDNGYLNSDGNFAYNPGKDIFIFQGQRYRSAGDTPVSQAGDEPLFIWVILSREETITGESKY